MTMKKLLTLCICFAIMLQTVIFPVKAEDDYDLTGLTDAAAGCAAFASTWQLGHGAENAVDGDADTFWKSGNSTNEHRFVLDLGAAYEVDIIGYLPQNDEETSVGFKIYLSNDNEFLEKTLVHDQGETATSVNEKSYFPVEEAENFRYVVVEKDVSAGKLGIAEINVYVQSGEGMIPYEETYHHVSNNMKGYRYGGSPSGISANTFSCETDVGQKAFHTSSGNPIYFMFDLGTAQNIGYVTYSGSTVGDTPSENDLGHRTDFKVIGSNNSDYSDYDVLAVQEGLAGNPDSNYSGMILYKTAEEHKNSKYRYVGIMAEKPVGGKVRFAVNSLNIFASKAVVTLKDKVDIAENCPAFASTYTVLHASQNAVDGNSQTFWESGTSVAMHSLVVDLGMEYPISVIGYLPPENSEYAGGFTIYGSNDNEMVEKAVLASQGTAAPLDKMTYYAAPDDSMYRYIAVEKASSDGGLGVADLKVYVHQDYISNTFGENNRVIHINNNLKAMRAGGSPSGMTAGAFSSENNTSMATHSSDGTPLYMMFDLGTAQSVSHIAYALNTVGSDAAQLDNRSNFMFIGTNDSTYQTYDVLAVQEGLAGRPDSNYSGLIVYETDPQFEVSKYRYVGALADEAFSGKIRFAANTMNFYTKTSQMAPITFNSIVAVMKDGKLNVKGSVISGSEGSFIFSAFDENHRYLGSVGAENVLENGGTANVDIEVDFGDKNIAAEDIDSVQLIITDNLSDMNLLGVIDNLTGEKEIWSVEADSALTYEETVTRNMQTYRINGTTDAPSVFAVIMEQGADFDSGSIGEIRYAEAKKTDAQGEFDFSFTFSDSDDFGEYAMKVGSEDSQSFGSSEVHILENVDTSELVEEFKNVSAEDFSELFDTYKDYFSAAAEDIRMFGDEFGKIFVMIRDGIELFNAAIEEIDSVQDIEAVFAAAIVTGCVESRTDYDDIISRYTELLPDIFSEYYDGAEFEELMSEVKKHTEPEKAEDFAGALKRAVGLSLIRDGNYKEIAAALKEYGDALGISEKTLETDITYLQIAKELKNTATAVKGYASGMDDTVSEIISRLEESSGGKSLGSGGSSGGPSSYTGYLAEAPKAEVIAPVVQEDAVYFDDLADYGWAKDAIGNLASRNILKGKGEGVFDPGSAVTREEAVKLIVLVFGFDMSENENAFEDCEKSEWYYPYVTAADEYAVVRGISGTEFGIGKKVTRQDLATMIYRALDRVGFNCETTASFADYDDIDLYAQYGVSTLASVGIIRGFENGCFMPKNNTTRAEAAVIFDRVLKLLEQTESN